MVENNLQIFRTGSFLLAYYSARQWVSDQTVKVYHNLLNHNSSFIAVFYKNIVKDLVLSL